MAVVAAAAFSAAETTPLLEDLTADLASCEDGTRDHVFMNAKGRVVVEKQ